MAASGAEISMPDLSLTAAAAPARRAARRASPSPAAIAADSARAFSSRAVFPELAT